jgi:hypothetical protein
VPYPQVTGERKGRKQMLLLLNSRGLSRTDAPHMVPPQALRLSVYRARCARCTARRGRSTPPKRRANRALRQSLEAHQELVEWVGATQERSSRVLPAAVQSFATTQAQLELAPALSVPLSVQPEAGPAPECRLHRF